MIAVADNLWMCLLSVYFSVIAVTIMFDQTFHHVHEDAELVQTVLILSNPSSFSFAVQVTNTDGSAIGEYCSIMINY